MKAINPIRSLIGLLSVALLLVSLPAGAQKVITKKRPVKTAPAKAKPRAANFSPTGTIAGHDYVDLGLSVKWATCNVGASSPEDYGDYFAWGETSPKSSYYIRNNKTYHEQMGSICSDSNYDAATANWGSSWRLPSLGEIKELLNGCTYTWTTRNGVKGGVFKSKKNGNAIFIPAAGHRDGTALDDAGSIGYVWSGSPDKSYTYSSNYLFFERNANAGWVDGYRSDGRSVRPVAE